MTLCVKCFIKELPNKVWQYDDTLLKVLIIVYERHREDLVA